MKEFAADKEVKRLLCRDDAPYRQVLEFAPDAVFVVDGDGQIVFVNSLGEDLFGYAREELISQGVEVLIPERFRRQHADQRCKFCKSPGIRTMGSRPDLPCRRRDGSEFPAEIALSPLAMDGETLMIAVIRDSTSRRHAEEKLRSALAAQEAIGRILQIALEPAPLREQFEKSLDVLFSIPWLGLLSQGAIFLREPETHSLVLVAQRGLPDSLLADYRRAPLGDCLCGRATATGEIVFVERADAHHETQYGEIVPHGHYCVPIHSEGEVWGVLNLYVAQDHVRSREEEAFLSAVAQVIAGAIKHSQTEGQLRESEERFGLAVRGTDAGIWDWDLRTNRVYFSPRWKSILGYEDEELQGDFAEWESRLHPADRDRALETIQAYLSGALKEYELEHRLRHKDGTYRWILARGASVCDEAGNPYRMVGSHLDITGRKIAEVRLQENELQLLAAERIQQHLLPTRPPKVAWLDIAGVSYPAVHAGGDFFDYLPMLGGAMGCVVGDVSGHGFAPALLMASTHAFFECLAQTCSTVGEIMFRANNFVTRKTEDEQFVTLLLSRLDAEKHTLTYLNAGHPSGYVLDSKGEIKAELHSNGFPLGIESNIEYPTPEPIPLQRGDMILLLTDGIVEAYNLEFESFGTQRALDLVRRHLDKSAQGVLAELIFAANQQQGREEALDDRTAMVIKVVE